MKSHYPVVGDAKLVLTQLLEELKLQSGSQGRPANQALVDEIKGGKQEWFDLWLPKLTSNEVLINSYRVVWDIMHTVDLVNVIVTHESGSVRADMTPSWEARQPRSFFGAVKSTLLRFSRGLALGA